MGDLDYDLAQLPAVAAQDSLERDDSGGMGFNRREMIQAERDSLEELIQAEWDSIGDWGIMQRGIKK